MVVISVEAHAKAKVCTITIGKRKLFWVRMTDVQKGRGFINICDLIRKQVQVNYKTEYSTEEQIRNYKRSEKN